MASQAGTHNGNFHADDLMSAALLVALRPDLTIVRTRNKATLDALPLLFDVGGTYDPARARFDHHFMGSPTRSSGSPYSSIGMLWKQFGRSAITQFARPKDDRERDYLFDWVDTNLIEPFDRADVGVPRLPDTHSLSSHLCAANPNWDEIEGLSSDANDALVDQRFQHCITWLARALTAFLSGLQQNPALALENFQITVRQQNQGFTEAFQASFIRSRHYISTQVDNTPTGNVLFLNSGSYAWDLILPHLKKAAHLLYVAYPTAKGQWRCQCVPTEAGGYEPRRPFPLAWRGLPENELIVASGLTGATFCHPAGFLLGLTTRKDLDDLLAHPFMVAA